MQDIREIYNKTKENLEGVLSRLCTELEQIQFVLDNNIVSSNGEPMDSPTENDVRSHLNDEKREVQEEIDLVNSQIKYLVDWLETNQ
jgi:hypothetical protein